MKLKLYWYILGCRFCGLGLRLFFASLKAVMLGMAQVLVLHPPKTWNPPKKAAVFHEGPIVMGLHLWNGRT